MHVSDGGGTYTPRLRMIKWQTPENKRLKVHSYLQRKIYMDAKMKLI